MANFFVWSEANFGLQIKEMDDEHKVLIDKMNKLHQAWENKAPAETMGPLLEDLAKYTIKHFADEEAYMERANYEGIKTHKMIHKQMLDQFDGHLKDFKNKKVLTDAFFMFLKVWLASHIRGIDMKYSQAVKKAA